MFTLLWRFRQLVAVVVGICSSQSSDVCCLPRSPDVDILVLFQSSVPDLRHRCNHGKPTSVICNCLTGLVNIYLIYSMFIILICKTSALCSDSTFLSTSLFVSKRGAYWDRLCRDVVGRLVGWLVVTRVHCGQMVHPRPIVTMEH